MDKQKRQVLQAIAKRAHEVTPPGSTILLFGRTLGWDIDEIINPMLLTREQWTDNRTAPFRINVLEDAIPL